MLAGCAFAAQFVFLDLVTRVSDTTARVAVVRSASLLLGAAAVLVARTRARRVVLALVAALLLVVQALVFRYYHAPLDQQVAATAVHAFRDVRPVLLRALPGLLAGVGLAAAAGFALLRLAHRETPPAPRALPAGLVLVALGLVLTERPRDATPEIAALHALFTLPRLAARDPAPRTATAVTLPPLFTTRSELPDVLFVLTESVRASDYVPSGPEATAPEAAALTSDRVDLTRLRAVSSYTAVSLSALLTGRSQEGAREDILRAPNLFDVAHATRDGRGRYRVLYVSAQSETVFEAKDVRASIDGFVTVETLLGRDVDDAEYETVPFDAQVVDRLEALLREDDRPVFAVLHLVGTHAPYFVDEARAPFTPFSHVVTWSSLPQLHNAYRNAILAQDRVVARALRAFEAHARARPRVVLFTSDHGEAFGEHGAIHHGQNLYDEQIHVPGWIWASPGALEPAERASLAAATDRYTTHLDLLPSLLDVLGLGDNTALRDVRARLGGASVLRSPAAPVAPVPVTNCTGMFPCPLDTWGVLAPGRKLVAQRWDGDWGCFDLATEERAAPPDDPACRGLREASRRTYRTLPNGRPND